MSCDQQEYDELHELVGKPTLPEMFRRRGRLSIEFEWTPRYSWYIIPTIELNFSIKEVGINIFCLGIYIGWGK